MWSDRYNYYNIKSDNAPTKKVATIIAVNALLKTGDLVQNGHQSFSHADHFPWVEITLTEAENGNFAATKKEIPFVNLIAIVCDKGPHTNQQVYVKTFLQIAESLGWKLYLETDDEGNEEILINH